MRRLLTALLLALAVWPAQARTQLTAPTTFYVAPIACTAFTGYWSDTGAAVTACGDDVNGNGTQAAPFATAQHVRDMLMTDYDLGCQPVTIQLATAQAPGQYIYTQGYSASGRIPGECGSFPGLYVSNKQTYTMGKYAPVTLKGDTANVNGAFIYPSVGSCVSLTDGTALQLYGIACDTRQTGQDCISVFNGSLLVAGSIWFGYAGSVSGSNLHWGAAFNSTIIMEGPEWVMGAAASHVDLGQFSSWYYDGNGNTAHAFPVTLAPNLHFPYGYFLIDQSFFLEVGAVYSGGPVTGPRFILVRGGVLETGSGKATWSNPDACNQAALPGNSPGLLNNGGGICD